LYENNQMFRDYARYKFTIDVDIDIDKQSAQRVSIVKIGGISH